MAEKEEMKYTPMAGFLNILKTGGAKGESFTLREMLTHLISYVRLKNIFDDKDVLSVNCEQDELQFVFGVPSFTKTDVMNLIKKNLYGAPQKRPGDSLLNEDPVTKMKKYFEPFPPLYVDIGENEYLFAENIPDCYEDFETDVVRDSTDEISSSSDNNIEPNFESIHALTYQVEFEVEDNNDLMSEPDTATDIESVVHTTVFSDDSDMAFWADGSNEESDNSESSDPDLYQDFWKCEKCGVNNKPISRYCLKCFAVRKNWLPSKDSQSKVMRRNLKKRQSRRKYVSSEQSSQENTSNGQESLDSSSNKDIASSSLNQEISSSCMICLQRPKSATLVHGRTGHQVCCYPCGRKLEEMKRRCPVCRRSISKVIKNFIL